VQGVALLVLVMRIRKKRNWSCYNQRLVKIARVDFYLSQEAIDNWYYRDSRSPGGKKIYSDHVIEMGLMMKEFYGLGYRQTEGFISSILSLSGYKDLLPPDYTTISRRCGNLSVKIRNKKRSFRLDSLRSKGGSLVVAIDSTGLSLYNYSDWHNLKHKEKSIRNIDRWRKLHIAIDVKSGEILSALSTNSREHDCRHLPALLDNIDDDIAAVCADMAYDNLDCRRAIMQKKAQQLIPPRRRAIEYSKNSYYNKVVENKKILEERDEAIKYIRDNTVADTKTEDARRLWKRKVGYHQRSLVETTMYQIKAHLGDRLTNKKEKTRDVQSLIKCKVVNMINYA